MMATPACEMLLLDCGDKVSRCRKQISLMTFKFRGMKVNNLRTIKYNIRNILLIDRVATTTPFIRDKNLKLYFLIII